MVSVFTGFLFLVMVTRSLSQSNFGLWEFIVDVLVFASFPVGYFTYWATREVARGAVIGKTTQVLCILMSAGGVVLYLVFSLGTYASIGSSFTPFIAALILVPLTYWTLSNIALVQGHNPAIQAYSLMVSEPAKLLVAYPLLYVYHLGINGVILSVAVAYLVQATVSTIQLRDVRKDRIDLNKGKEWLGFYQVPSIYAVTYVLGVADTFVASISSHGTVLTGAYQAAFQVATIVGYSSYLSIALYPLLLRGKSERLPGQVLEFALLFGIPMATGSIALAPRILYLLKPAYVGSTTALVLLSLASVATLVSGVIDQTLMGRERADLEVEDKSKKILRSDLMFVPAANTTYFVVYLTAVFLIARASVASSMPVSEFATYWALSQLLLLCGLVVGKMVKLLRKTSMTLTVSSLYYVVASAAMGAALYFASGDVVHSGEGTLDYGLRLIGLVVVGACIYFGLLFAVDSKFRSVAKAVLKMLKGS